MGRGSSKAGGGGGGQSSGAPTSSLPLNVNNSPTNAKPLTDAYVDKLRKQEDASYDASTTAAVKMYISAADFDNQGHSLSQTMNYLLDNGVDLNTADVKKINKQYGLRLNQNDLASMQYTNAYLSSAVHSIGQDAVLLRGAHDDMLRNAFGINDYSKLSQSQLQSQLVGKAMRTTSFWSTSYDDNRNPFTSSKSSVSGGREVIYNIRAGKNTKCVIGAKKQSEIVLDKGTNFKVTGVRYTGRTATPKGKGSRPQIEIDLETF